MNTPSKTLLLQEYFENASILANLKASYFSFANLDDQIAQIERQMRGARKMRKLARSTRSSGARRTAEHAVCL
jgi:outer membrane protein TolC